MTVLVVDAGTLAHGIHYGIVGFGILGLVVLLGPQLVRGPVGEAPRDEHELRVRAIAGQIADGSLGRSPLTVAPLLARAPRSAADLLPVAVVASTGAAGVHAAVAPAHFADQLLFGVFFAVTALLQIAWATAAVVRPSLALLQVAVVGNAVAVALWLTTRTVGIPGVLPHPEAVGPWDLACAAWEVVVVVTCVRLVQASPTAAGLRVQPWDTWSTGARVWALCSTVCLVLLTFSGAGS